MTSQLHVLKLDGKTVIDLVMWKARYNYFAGTQLSVELLMVPLMCAHVVQLLLLIDMLDCGHTCDTSRINLLLQQALVVLELNCCFL